MRDLLEIRNEIDELDDKIVELYERRMQLTTEVAEYKIETGKQIFDKEREDSKLHMLEEKTHTEITRKGVRELFQQIMAMSRKNQYKLLTAHPYFPISVPPDSDYLSWCQIWLLLPSVSSGNSP